MALMMRIMLINAKHIKMRSVYILLETVETRCCAKSRSESIRCTSSRTSRSCSPCRCSSASVSSATAFASARVLRMRRPAASVLSWISVAFASTSSLVFPPANSSSSPLRLAAPLGRRLDFSAFCLSLSKVGFFSLSGTSKSSILPFHMALSRLVSSLVSVFSCRRLPARAFKSASNSRASSMLMEPFRSAASTAVTKRLTSAS
mmetsp:Transcript_1009/g.4319  ORF Transcript_1009/g.4319 Transcript_1009/m.4319 type:complete len:204 (-) Transcript_1009:235-846(-)